MIRLSYLLFALLLLCTWPAQAATLAELSAAQQQLVSHLKSEIAKSEAGEKDLRAQMKTGKPLEYAIDPQKLLTVVAEQRKGLKQFLQKVSAAQPAALPSTLAEMRLSCTQGRCESGLDLHSFEDALIAYGPLVLPSLQASWPKLDEYGQESLIYLSGRFTPSECRSSWLDEILNTASVHRVRFAALRVVKNTCLIGELWPRLDAALAKEQNPELLLALLDLVEDTLPQSATYRRRLIEMTEQGRIPLDMAFPKICTEPAPKLELVQRPINSAFWLAAYQKNPNRQMCLVNALFVQIANPQTLSELTPVLSDAASHLYGFTATDTMSGRVTHPYLTQWNSRPGLDMAMLSTFRANIPPSTLITWLNQPGMDLGNRLLLTNWLTQDPRGLLADPLSFTITVSTPEGQLVSQHTAPVSLDTYFDFTIPSTGDFPAIQYQGTLQFNGSDLHYVINNFLVGLQPAAAGFSATIPLLGKYTIDLIAQGKPYRWSLSVTSSQKN